MKQKEDAPIPMSLTDQYRYEAMFWQEQVRELERLLKCHDGERREYWKMRGEIETLLVSAGGEVEQATVTCGNLVGLKRLVKLYQEVRAKSAD